MNNFFNDKEIQTPHEIEMRYDEDVMSCVNLLTTEFSFQPSACPRIESSLLYKAFQSATIVGTFKTISSILEIAIYQVQYSWTSGGGKSITRHYDQCFLGLLFLQKEFPSTCILKETLQTRINDWFAKQDVDFEKQKKFSKLFHVISNDKMKLELLLKDRPLDELTAFPKMEAEIHGRYCLIRVSKDPASEYDVRQLIELANKMHHVFS